MCTLNNKVTYFDGFGVEHIPIKIKHFISNKNMQTNIFRMQAYDFVMCGYFCIGFADHKLKGKGLTDFTTFFLPINFWKNDDIISNRFKNGWIPNIYPNLNDQQQFGLNKVNELKDCFIAEIRERELMSKRLGKYIASFNYFDKSLILLSATSGAPIGISIASFSLAFSIATGNVKKC